MKAPASTPVPGPAFIRLLARLTDADVPSSGPVLSERLGQWIDWTRAVALSRALDGRPPAADGAATPAFDDAGDEACARVRASLAGAIADDGELAGAAPESADAAADYAPFRQRYLAMQREMQAATGRLRGRLRDRLAAGPAGMARLAEVDAVMEAALSPREHALLAAVPTLLGRHFERLHPAGRERSTDAQAAGAPTPAHGAWRDAFRHDMRGVLLAELDVRFHPIEGLLAALRTR